MIPGSNGPKERKTLPTKATDLTCERDRPFLLVSFLLTPVFGVIRNGSGCCYDYYTVRHHLFCPAAGLHTDGERGGPQ